eukprot:CAMPEP_0118698500 /NCGR_PEP_ID=MMETSP0800-20121206/15244_1 /TAXON_ID=210618 ORGANISM="Striatella unipunctata, Strain CCMP2910" /NCGR_SAMPLE_ID=MMETSP0800 /ASSEMBLY_ACC=CAM_ASM_000638 /LENGTH=180 /DNA_ID=CAMNT_0006598345 /DNA_START=315 /DNA_END=857 /DNA_ORIENTATION=-
MCRGPWRRDVDATVFAVLHRLETAMTELSKENPDVRCTVIVLMGKPVCEENNKDSENREDTTPEKEKEELLNPFRVNLFEHLIGQNDEDYYVHSNLVLAHRLIDLSTRHYPERLARALIVPGNGFTKTLTTFGLRAYIAQSRTRARITILKEARELQHFVRKNVLIDIAGGKASMNPNYC